MAIAVQPKAELTTEIAAAAADSGGLPDDIAISEPLIELPDCDSAAVVALVRELGLHSFAAQTLVRRGYDTVDAARKFIEVGPLEDPATLPGVTAAAAAIAGHLKSGTRIAVHGDYDVDGVCSTAILVRTLARLGAEVTWHVPSRFEDGYGLSRAAIDRLAADGAGLIVTVDCGIGSVAEVEHARSLNVDVVICDHHKPGPVLPDAPVVHPALGEYPCPELCAAATTFKLAQVLCSQLDRDPAEIDDELELVAFATVCDVVPLRGENRAFVHHGLAAMRQTLRPGLRELMRVAAVDQLQLDAGSLGYAMGPRINAAGRMFSAEPAVELMLTTNEARAAELATQLNSANGRRREIEQSILFEAETQARAQRDQFAIVVAAEGWHPGVLGIIAGRIAERFHRPCVALAIEDGVASGSGRNGGIYDLHGGLEACSSMLIRFGGHRAAAGLELEQSALPAFTRALQAHAAASLAPDDLRPHVRVDAVGEPSQITLDATESLAALGPFGAGNREPQILLPAVTVTQLRKMGDRGQHLRLGVAGRGGRTGVVAFGWETAVASGDDAPLVNIVVKVQRNEFRGQVEAQAKLVALAQIGEGLGDEWERAFLAEFAAAVHVAVDGGGLDDEASIDRRADTPLAAIAELAAETGESVVVVNDPVEWQGIARALAQVDPRFAQLSMRAYGDAELTGRRHRNVILAEPPAAPALAHFNGDQVTIAWNSVSERVISSRGADLLLDRSHVVNVFRALKDAQPTSWAALAPLIESASPSARIAAQVVRTLEELSIIRVNRNGDAVESIEVVDSPKTALDLSDTFRSYSAYREESKRWLHQISADQKAHR